MSGARLVDARGLLCPWPALRLARAARELGKGRIRILADDPSAAREIAQLCADRGWKVESEPHDRIAYNVLIG
jgi:tRNA 2-thiouridine synthesizing protein A